LSLFFGICACYAVNLMRLERRSIAKGILALAMTALLLSVAALGADKKTPKALDPAEISKRAAASTVVIQCAPDPKAATKTPAGDATGFLVSESGQIVTSLRSILQCNQITVKLSSGDVYDNVSVLDLDVRRDLVVLKIKAASLAALPLGDSNALEIGQTLHSSLFPSQKAPISGFRQMDGYKLVQISAAAAFPGGAGGPVLDDQGAVAGIAVPGVAGAEGQSFALPVNYVKGYLDGKSEMPFPTLVAVVKATAASLASSAKTQPGAPATPVPPKLYTPPVIAGGVGSGGGIGNGSGCVGAGCAATNPPAGGAYKPGNGVTEPKVLQRVEPAYSEEARKAKWQGTVIVSLVVDEKGKATNVTVVRPLGLGLDEKAIEAVKKWVFAPGTKDGKPVPVTAQIEITFNLL
jgi:TonB family protein